MLGLPEESSRPVTGKYKNRSRAFEDIRELLHDQRIRLMTTKTGDVIVRSIGDHTGAVEAINLCAGSTEISSRYEFRSKKSKLLSYNADTIRQLYSASPSYRWL
jgi:competence protein ComEC